MLNIVFLIIILASLIMIGSIIIRKFSLLANLNIDQLKSQQQAEVKVALLEKRLKRKFDWLTNFLKSSVWKNFWQELQHSYQKIVSLEKKYLEERRIKKTSNLPLEAKTELLEDKMGQAADLIKSDQLEDAEKIYLEIVASEPYNVDAYLGLAQIYFKQKDFAHAQELYNFVLKLNKKKDLALSGLGNLAAEQGDWNNAKKHYQESINSAQKKPEYYIDLAMAEYQLGNPGRALTAIRKASDLEPKNPKYLDFLTDAAIINKNKILALESFNKLKEINPDNQKLAEFRTHIQEI